MMLSGDEGYNGNTIYYKNMEKDNQNNLKTIYQKAYDFLLNQSDITKEIIDAHLKPEYNKLDDIKEVFKKFCNSAQNKQMSSKVIGGSIGKIESLTCVLFNFNPHKTAKKYSKNSDEELLNDIIIKLKPTGQIRRTPRSLWPQFCRSVIDSAHFLNQFKNANEFYIWANSLLENNKFKPALPLIISLEIRGFGLPLTCDVLKEIGYSEFGKPDIHLKDIFKALNLIDPEEKNNLKQDYCICG
jgi:hypothetical protein